MWEYCDPKDHINTERLFTGSEHKNKQRTWLVAASMHVGETTFNKLFGPKSHFFFFRSYTLGVGFFCALKELILWLIQDLHKKTELKKIGGTGYVSSLVCCNFMLKILFRLLLTCCSLLFGDCKSAHPQHNETAIKITQQSKSYLLPFCFPIFIPFYSHTFCVQVDATYHWGVNAS